MKKLILISLVLVLAACSKKVELNLSCDTIDSEFLGAEFLLSNDQVSTEHDHSEQEHAEKKITLWRVGTRVAHQYHDPAITMAWAQDSNKDLLQTQYFDVDKRAIEFEARRIVPSKRESVWSEKDQIIAQYFIDQMTLERSYGEKCNTTNVYTLKTEDIEAELHWLSELRLPAEFEVIQSGEHVHWRLQSIEASKDAVVAAITDRESYLATDYADIGDNETDPFLRSMMNLGFVSHGASGFYDSEGNNLGGGHRH